MLDQLGYDQIGQLERLGNLIGGERPLSFLKAPNDQAKNMQRIPPAKIQAGIAVVDRHDEMVDMLVGVGNFSTQQHNHPTQLQPDQKERQGGKAAVDRIVFGYQYLGADIDALKDLISRTADDTG